MQLICKNRYAKINLSVGTSMRFIIPKQSRIPNFSAIILLFIGSLLISLQCFGGPLEIEHTFAKVGDTEHEHSDFDLCQLLSILSANTISPTTFDHSKPHWESPKRINLYFLAEISRFLPESRSPRAPPSI